MNEQASMMNQPMMNPQPPPPALMSAMVQQPPPQLMNPPQSQPPPQVIVNNLIPNRGKLMSFFPPQLSPNNSRMKRQKPYHFLNASGGFCHSQMHMNPPQPQQQQQQMMNRGYGMWGHPPPMDFQLKYQNPNPMKTQGGGSGGGFGKPPSKHQLAPRNNWKGKKVGKPDKRMDLGRRIENPMPMGGGSSGALGIAGSSVGNVGGGFNPPSLKDLQYQNRVKTRRYFQKNYYNNKNNNRGKFAPRNTTSFIIRAKKSGGIAELVSPCPVTPAVLPTPVFSPSREVLVDMAKEEWGVDGYGSMKGLIRLRSPGNEGVEGHEEEEEDEGGSSESDVEEHVEVERRLDHDLSRFEMIYPNYGTVGGMEYNNLLENRVDDQDSHIVQLEEENLILKERLFLMERELGDLRRRLQSLERQSHDGDYVNEEVVENMSENESDSRGGTHSMEDNNEELGEENVEANLDSRGKQENFFDANGNTLKTEEKKAEIRSHNENRDKVKDNIVELNEQNTNDGNNNGEEPINSAVGEGQEQSKDEISVSDIEQNVQKNKSSNDDVEELDKTPVDVCMDEVAYDGKGFIEEN